MDAFIGGYGAYVAERFATRAEAREYHRTHPGTLAPFYHPGPPKVRWVVLHI